MTRENRRRMGRGGVVATLAVVVAVGGVIATAGRSSAHPAGVDARAVKAAATANDTLIVAVPSDMQNLDPTLSSADVPTQETLTNVYDWLVDYKVVSKNGSQIGDANQFVGGLAKSFSWNGKHTVLTFKLRPNLKFSNGDPLDAAAVKFTYDRIFGQKGVTVGNLFLSGITKPTQIKVVNSSTVTFTVSKPNTLIFGNMAQFGNSILDPKLIKSHATSADPFAHNWLGSNVGGGAQGPFILQSWQHGNQWVLARNPNYWGPKPKLAKVIFKIIPDPSTRLSLLKSGSVDMAYDLPLKDIKSLQSDKDVKIVRQPSRFVVFLGMNSDNKPFNDKRVRQAISYAVPTQTIIQQVLQGYGRPLTSPVPFGTPTHSDAYDHYKIDYDKAKALLKEAGYPNGFSTTLDIASGVDEASETAVWVQQSLAKVGIKVQIQQLPGAAFAARLQKHDLPFFFFNNWISINNDPYYHLYWLFSSPCCNYTNYKNKTVDATINKWLLSTNKKARDAGSLQMQKTIVDDAPWAFLYQPDFVLAMRSNVKGYTYYSSDRFTRFKFISKS